MTTSPSPEAAASALFSRLQPQAPMTAWQFGSHPQKLMGAMMLSAGAKKPGRVTKRISKHLDGLFEAPRIVAWEKDDKFVYAMALSQGAAPEARMTDASAQSFIFQTDLHVRTRGEYTEVVASTGCALRRDVVTAIAARGGEDLEKEVRRVLSIARVFASGFEKTDIAPENPVQFLIPMGGIALEGYNLPIERIEYGEIVTRQILVITALREADTLDVEDLARMGNLAQAMTKEGYPGDEAFGALIAANARPIAS